MAKILQNIHQAEKGPALETTKYREIENYQVNEWAFKSGNYTDPLSQERYSDSIELRTIFSKSIDPFLIIISPGFFYRYTESPLGLTYFCQLN
ncbi:MAG: hypothetical protein A3J72_04275 [Nitrospirae bacterium RIFCSPHIGHO2_02_FULL_40_19]|nr:MAG: hypothetical protein A3J72_04275 [Nitrospirae bacterium RIFCSPHIGHO2_02_FULL_40_19]